MLKSQIVLIPFPIGSADQLEAGQREILSIIYFKWNLGMKLIGSLPLIREQLKDGFGQVDIHIFVSVVPFNHLTNRFKSMNSNYKDDLVSVCVVGVGDFLYLEPSPLLH